MKSFTIQEISAKVEGVLIGNTDKAINGPEQLQVAGENHITFIGNKKYAKLWEHSGASAAVVDEKLNVEPGPNRALIKVKNADLAMAKILELFDPGLPSFDVIFIRQLL